MKIQGLLNGETISVAVIGVPPLAVNYQTGDIIFPEGLTKDQYREVRAQILATFPNATDDAAQ